MQRLFAAGDPASYNEFPTLISRYLRGFLRKYIAVADCEDVLQEILISLHKARHTYDGKRPMRAPEMRRPPFFKECL